jgi:hypothetical protein
MKARFIYPFVFAWLLGGAVCCWAGSAQVQLVNHSIKMHPGPCSCGFGMVWKLHFSTVFTEEPLHTNGELARRPAGSATTHWAYMLLEDPSMYSSVTLAEINLPPDQDLNKNGIPDFYDISQEVATGSSGIYHSSLGGGTLTLAWNRTAGSTVGSCVLYMYDRVLGQIGPFTHPFELVGYEGDMTYKKGVGGVSGTIGLRRAGQVMWQGEINFTRSVADPYNTLGLAAGVWTNATDSFSFETATITRDPTQPSLYQGTIKNPAGTFREWYVWIMDPTDSNNNGIPDLSDDLEVEPPRAPSLKILQKAARLELEINGETGRKCEVQTASSLDSPSWETVTTLTLSSETQAVEISAPATGAKFWRVKIE